MICRFSIDYLQLFGTSPTSLTTNQATYDVKASGDASFVKYDKLVRYCLSKPSCFVIPFLDFFDNQRLNRAIKNVFCC